MPYNEALVDKRSRGGHYRIIERKDACRSVDRVVNLPGKTPDESNKLVQIFGTSPTYDRAENNNRETKHVLLPLDEEVLLPAPGEQTVLHNPDGREKLQRSR